MGETPLATLHPRTLVPLPVVVDADVLLRNVDYTIRRAAATPSSPGASGASATAFACSVIWTNGRYVYRGFVRVFYQLERVFYQLDSSNTVVWTDTDRVHRARRGYIVG